MQTERKYGSPLDRVAVLPFKGVENAYLVLSGARRSLQPYEGEGWQAKGEHKENKPIYRHEFRVEPRISFLYDAGDVCAEWDGECGPIQLAYRTYEGYQVDDYNKAEKHWFYDWAIWRGHWSQMAVDEAGLPQAFNRGEFDYIFRVLKSWTNDRESRYPTQPPENNVVSMGGSQ